MPSIIKNPRIVLSQRTLSIPTDLGTPIETYIVHMLLLKNPQFLPPMIMKLGQNHRVKIVDFLIEAYVL